jgi:TPR repeat protein
MSSAQLEYAVMLLRGLGLTRDEPKAISYLKAAAQAGLPAAQNRLAYCYSEGVIVAKDPVEAAKWRLIAKAGGLKDPDADAFVTKLPKDKLATAEKAADEWREQAGLF